MGPLYIILHIHCIFLLVWFRSIFERDQFANKRSTAIGSRIGVTWTRHIFCFIYYIGYITKQTLHSILYLCTKYFIFVHVYFYTYVTYFMLNLTQMIMRWGSLSRLESLFVFLAYSTTFYKINEQYIHIYTLQYRRLRTICWCLYFKAIWLYTRDVEHRMLVCRTAVPPHPLTLRTVALLPSDVSRDRSSTTVQSVLHNVHQRFTHAWRKWIRCSLQSTCHGRA